MSARNERSWKCGDQASERGLGRREAYVTYLLGAILYRSRGQCVAVGREIDTVVAAYFEAGINFALLVRACH